MVWFQCEDCGDELKKPKLPNHFRICSASKLSCIDCGVMFSQDNVQTHTQCITEAEKYGPKGQPNKAQNRGTPTPNKDLKPIDFDIYAGLSDRPPWFCSLCNSKATSKQTLLLHADGKKHRAKAKAFHHANQPANKPEEIPIGGGGTYSADTNGFDVANGKSETMNGYLEKKRKHDGSESDGSGEIGDGPKGEKMESQVKKVKKDSLKDDKEIEAEIMKDEDEDKIQWKRVIRLALQYNPDGVLKMKKLKKIVVKLLRKSGFMEDESELFNILEKKVNSSSRFRVEGKYVHLVPRG